MRDTGITVVTENREHVNREDGSKSLITEHTLTMSSWHGATLKDLISTLSKLSKQFPEATVDISTNIDEAAFIEVSSQKIRRLTKAEKKAYDKAALSRSRAAALKAKRRHKHTLAEITGHE